MAVLLPWYRRSSLIFRSLTIFDCTVRGQAVYPHSFPFITLKTFPVQSRISTISVTINITQTYSKFDLLCESDNEIMFVLCISRFTDLRVKLFCV